MPGAAPHFLTKRSPQYVPVSKALNDMSIEDEINKFEESKPWDEALNDRGSVYAGPAIYAITTRAPFQRLNSQTRVLYIGKTGALGGTNDRCRLYAYRYAPAGQHGARVRLGVSQVSGIGHDVILRWTPLESEGEAKVLESVLLEAYAEEHLELPPFNRKG